MVRFPRQNSLKSASLFTRCDWNGIQRGLKILRPWKRDWGFNSPHRHQLICSSQRTRLRQRNGNGVVGGQRVVDHDEQLRRLAKLAYAATSKVATSVGSNPSSATIFGLSIGMRIGETAVTSPGGKMTSDVPI